MEIQKIKENELAIDTSTFFDSWFKNSCLFTQFLLDESGVILKASEGAKTFYGYELEDLIGKNFSVLFTDKDRIKGKPEKELKNALEKATAAEVYIVHKNGVLIWSHGEMVRIKGKYGERYFIKTIYDIDQQRILEEFLIASEEKQSLLSAMFDSFISGIEVFKSIRNEANEIIDFEYVLINKAAEKALLRNRNEFIGKKVLDIYPELKEIGIIDLQKKVIETGESDTIEFFYDKQGLNNWFKAAFVKFGDGVILTFEDITAEKSTNAELEKTTAFLVDSQELSHVCNFEWDIVNDKITGTPEFYQLFGFEEKSPKVFEYLERVVAEDREKVQYSFVESVNSRIPFEIEYKIKLPEGNFRSVFEKGKIIFDENGKPIKLIGTVADVTSIKNFEGNLRTIEDKLKKVSSEQDEKVNERTEELLIANKQLNKIIEELDKYAYIVSHDLRSPLNSMEGLMFLLGEDYRKKSLDAEGEKMLEMINSKIQNMKELISQVLKSAKEDKKIKEPLSLYELVQEVIRTLNPPSHFHVYVAHDLPNVKYHKTSLIQIFQNLIGNAIKYMDKDKPLITISSIEREKEYEIRIYDNGRGIPANKLDKIFNIFEVGHENQNIESHGLGLSIAQKLIEENKGRIWVESQEGIETNFYFTILKD